MGICYPLEMRREECLGLAVFLLQCPSCQDVKTIGLVVLGSENKNHL